MIAEARAWLHGARKVAVLTGAGISAESGIPTFRGAGGLWRQFRPEDLATPEAFASDPVLVWEWYDWRRGLIAATRPNAGHLALVELQRRVGSFQLITQNVDGLHRRAGSEGVICLHGDIWILRCTGCHRAAPDYRAKLDPLPPYCQCGRMQRPGVVWFGEMLPQAAWAAAEKAAREADVFLIVGTSAAVMPAGGLASVAHRRGAKVIEVNAEETWISGSVDLSLRGPAGEILPALVEPVS
jgi:NAD-dependent deacetylase